MNGIRITNDGSETYKCAYPDCTYSSSHDGGYGGFYYMVGMPYCEAHYNEILRSMGLLR